MAVASPKPASSRLEVAGKLTALIGLPLLVLFLIFATGVYCGASRSYRVQVLEAKWLGMAPPSGAGAEVEAEAPAGETATTEGEPAPAGETEGPREPTPPEQGEPKPSAPEQAPVQAPETRESEPPQQAPETSERPSAARLPTAAAEPIGPELRSRFDEALVVRVKLMVDPALVVAREDWLGYAAELVEATHASFEVLFGVDVQLQGVVIWEGVEQAGPDALLADLATREREGADVVLGLVARSPPAGYEARSWTGDEHGDHALVFADLQQGDRYYRNLLRTLAGLLGAEPAVDASSQQLGSFMSDAAPPAGAAPVIDPENRGRVIINKRRPFADSVGRAAPEADTPDQGAEGETTEM